MILKYYFLHFLKALSTGTLISVLIRDIQAVHRCIFRIERRCERALAERGCTMGRDTRRSTGRQEGYERELRRRKILKQRKAKRRRRRILLFVVEAALLAVVLLGIYFVSAYEKLQKPEFTLKDVKKNELDSEVEESMTGFTTYALFGVDARDNATLDKGTHGDVVMVASVNNATGEVRLASIYRDTYCQINEEGEYGKLTGAYFQGGALNAINMLNKNFDLDISAYATFNWAAVAIVINDLGGVDVDVPESMMVDQMLNGYTTLTAEATGINSRLTYEPGMQNLDGIQAVAYCRIRYISGDDFGRTGRQREVVEKVLEKAKKADIGTLTKIVNDAFPNLATNMELKDIVKLLPKVGSYYVGDQSGFPSEQMRANATIDGGAMVVPVTLVETAEELHRFLYGNETYVPSATVQEISAVIRQKSGT